MSPYPLNDLQDWVSGLTFLFCLPVSGGRDTGSVSPNRLKLVYVYTNRFQTVVKDNRPDTVRNGVETKSFNYKTSFLFYYNIEQRSFPNSRSQNHFYHHLIPCSLNPTSNLIIL